MNNKTETIIEVNNLRKSFKKDEQQDLLVLEDVNFELNNGEIVLKARMNQLLLLEIGARVIPVRHLNTDKNTDNDDDKIDTNRNPVLGFHMFDDAAQQQISSPVFRNSTRIRWVG